MKILITEPEYFPQESRTVLETVGRVTAKRLTRKELLSEIADVDVLVVRIETNVDREIIDAAPKLKIIASATTGLNHIDTAYAEELRIKVINLVGNHTVPTAEHTFAMLLGLARKIPWAHAELSSGKWERYKFFGRALEKKTLGIIGLGRIGSQVAKYAAGFRMRVLAYDPYVTKEYANSFGAELIDFDKLLSESDFISIHAALTHETRNMVGNQEFAKMKPSAMLINVARGEIVEPKALIGALESGRIAGAATDVFAAEPAGSNDLLVEYSKTHTNLLVTPHLGASTIEAINEASIFVANKVVEAVRSGE